MANFADYYEYSKLAAAAYVDLTNFDGRSIASAANSSAMLPAALANQTFDSDSAEANASVQPVWTVSPGSHQGNDPVSGFASTLFE